METQDLPPLYVAFTAEKNNFPLTLVNIIMSVKTFNLRCKWHAVSNLCSAIRSQRKLVTATHQTSHVNNKARTMNDITWPPADEDQEVGTKRGQHRRHAFQYDVQWQPGQSKSPGTGADVHWSALHSPACQSDDEPSSVSPGSAATNHYRHRHTT